MRYRHLMCELLEELRTVPLKPTETGDFLRQAAKLAMVDAITTDDWKYLARLVLYRIDKYVLNK